MEQISVKKRAFLYWTGEEWLLSWWYRDMEFAYEIPGQPIETYQAYDFYELIDGAWEFLESRIDRTHESSIRTSHKLEDLYVLREGAPYLQSRSQGSFNCLNGWYRLNKGATQEDPLDQCLRIAEKRFSGQTRIHFSARSLGVLHRLQDLLMLGHLEEDEIWLYWTEKGRAALAEMHRRKKVLAGAIREQIKNELGERYDD